VEAYHAGLVRTSIQQFDVGGVYTGYTQKVSTLRSALSKAALSTVTTDDYPLQTQQVSLAGGAAQNATTLIDADPTNVIAFSRNTTQVLNIVTGGGALTANTKATGVFFPNGLNGLFQ